MDTLKTINSNSVKSAAAPSSYPAGFGENLASVPGSKNSNPEAVVLQPLTQFPGDIIVAAGTVVNIPIQLLMGSKCVGFEVVNVTTPPVGLNINGGGFRNVFQDMSFDGCNIFSLSVNGGTGGCTIQLIGV